MLTALQNPSQVIQYTAVNGFDVLYIVIAFLLFQNALLDHLGKNIGNGHSGKTDQFADFLMGKGDVDQPPFLVGSGILVDKMIKGIANPCPGAAKGDQPDL